MPRMFKDVWNPVIFIHDIDPLVKEFLFTVEKDRSTKLKWNNGIWFQHSISLTQSSWIKTHESRPISSG